MSRITKARRAELRDPIGTRNRRIARLEAELRMTAELLHKLARETDQLGISPTETGEAVIDRVRTAHRLVGGVRLS